MTLTRPVDTHLAPPRFARAAAAALARDGWGIEGSLTPLPSERDQNHLIATPAGERFVLKISEPAEDPEFLDCQNAVLERLEAAGLPCRFPSVVATARGEGVLRAAGPDGAVHLVRLLRYVPGRPMGRLRHHPPALLDRVGALMGMITRALDGFSHPAARRDLRWDLRVARTVVAQCADAITQSAQRATLDRHLAFIDGDGGPAGLALRTSVIHNDANDYNLLVSDADPADPRVHNLSGLVDFGDLVESYTAAEVAVAAAYAMLHKRDPLAAAASVVRGYHARYPLTEDEVAAVYPFALLRLCTSAVLAAHQRLQEPDNAYLGLSEAGVWTLLERLASVSPMFALYRLRDACGLEPCPAAPAVVNWLTAHGDELGPVLEPDPARSRRVTLDLSVGSTEWSALGGLDDAAVWSAAIATRLRESGATLAIGRYDEARWCYTADQFRAITDDDAEWRTVHLGVDLFAPPGTPVRSPMSGRVTSVRDNGGRLDYGPTVILRHGGEAGVPEFYTLYGHLDRGVLEHLQEGQPVDRGTTIGHIGPPSDNGGWAPHLHLQIIVDRLGMIGDFPGVASPSERSVWRSVAPDPNLILRFREGPSAPQPANTAQLLDERRLRLGPSLSVAYRAPLTIVRGWMQHLYDAHGQPFLDVVNNVAHVGHCHPRVVEALGRQSAVLNTNTRYLHDQILRYAERLTAHLPEPLTVCYFVCSGSEANELALRLARAHTGRRDVIVVDHAYHGSTSALVELSPYKFDGPGGAGAPPHVHKVPIPDPYRGPYRSYDVDAGRRYAAHVGEAARVAAQAGHPIGAFFAEAIVSGGGQVEPPAGYLADAYRFVRAAGGVCVADEVQTGFGRLGTDFWAFETQGVVPDIVTMGKPIGNGHPLAAVVTTPEIAASFANGMEYFNTFGGNPVSCAVGLAVLDVVEEDGLQAHARSVGAILADGLRGLMARHSLVGDVRGRGLFLGVELVRDRETLQPAPHHAAYVVERMRERGILLSTEGPWHTVIKMKPPLVFTATDAERLIVQLDAVLTECEGTG